MVMILTRSKLSPLNNQENEFLICRVSIVGLGRKDNWLGNCVQ